MKQKPFSVALLDEKILKLQQAHGISKAEARYFVFTGSISNQAYNMDLDTINLLTKKGKVVDVAKASDQLNLKALSNKVVKHYLCFTKGDELDI